MTSCFDTQLIGVRCGDTDLDVSTSGLYLNDLPGLNVAFASMIADAETVTGSELLSRCIDMGIRLAEGDFVRGLKAKMKIYPVVNRYRYGSPSKDGTFSTTANLVSGMVIRKAINDEYIKPTLQYIEFLLDFAAPVRQIIITVDGVQQAPIEWEPLAGWNKIPINLPFYEILEVQTNVDDLMFSDSRLSSSCTCLYAACFCAQCVTVSPIAGTSTFDGMMAIVECNGDLCPILEVYQDDFAMAALYRAGSFFLEELISTQRVNNYVRGGREWAIGQLGRWMGERNPVSGFWEKGEYQTLIENIVESASQTMRISGSKAFAETMPYQTYYIP